MKNIKNIKNTGAIAESKSLKDQEIRAIEQEIREELKQYDFRKVRQSGEYSIISTKHHEIRFREVPEEDHPHISRHVFIDLKYLNIQIYTEEETPEELKKLDMIKVEDLEEIANITEGFHHTIDNTHVFIDTSESYESHEDIQDYITEAVHPHILKVQLLKKETQGIQEEYHRRIGANDDPAEIALAIFTQRLSTHTLAHYEAQAIYEEKRHQNFEGFNQRKYDPRDNRSREGADFYEIAQQLQANAEEYFRYYIEIIQDDIESCDIPGVNVREYHERVSQKIKLAHLLKNIERETRTDEDVTSLMIRGHAQTLKNRRKDRVEYPLHAGKYGPTELYTAAAYLQILGDEEIKPEGFKIIFSSVLNETEKAKELGVSRPTYYKRKAQAVKTVRQVLTYSIENIKKQRLEEERSKNYQREHRDFIEDQHSVTIYKTDNTSGNHEFITYNSKEFKAFKGQTGGTSIRHNQAPIQITVATKKELENITDQLKIQGYEVFTTYGAIEYHED